MPASAAEVGPEEPAVVDKTVPLEPLPEPVTRAPLEAVPPTAPETPVAKVDAPVMVGMESESVELELEEEVYMLPVAEAVLEPDLEAEAEAEEEEPPAVSAC